MKFVLKRVLDSRGVLASVLSLAAVGCSDDAPKAWSQFSACLAGNAAGSPVVARVKQLRLIALANAAPSSDKNAWPKRCSGYADDLYASLSTSGETASLRRKLHERFGCGEEKGSCAVPTDGSVVSISAELWDAAKAAALAAEPAPGVPVPQGLPPPLFDAQTLKSFSTKPLKLVGPELTSDGRAVVLLKTAEGRTKPLACEFAAGFSKVACVEPHADVPELPAHGWELVNDKSGVFAAGLTETGLVAYNLRTGEKSAVRGTSQHLLRDGVVVEAGTKAEAPSAPGPSLSPIRKPAKPAKQAKQAKQPAKVSEEGFVGVELEAGKASKEVKLPTSGLVGKPTTADNQIVFLSQSEAGVELAVEALAHGRVKPVARLKGDFSGAFHQCRAGDSVALATFGPRAGQGGAKPTAGADKTQLSVVFEQNGKWSGPVAAAMPFARSTESDLVCSKTGASLVWVTSGGGGVQVGRVDCTAEGCKSTDVKLPGLESKWWWAAAPLGDKVFLLWRSTLGETRLRIAPLGELATAKDTLVFDEPDFGGPNAGELSAVLTNEAALLFFRSEQPVALRLGADGSLLALAP